METAPNNEPASEGLAGEDAPGSSKTKGEAAAPGEAAVSEESAPRASGPSPFPMKSPLDGSPLAEVEPTDPASIPEIVERARKAQKAWAELPIRERADIIAKTKQRILHRAEEIADLVHKECGKPI